MLLLLLFSKLLTRGRGGATFLSVSLSLCLSLSRSPTHVVPQIPVLAPWNARVSRPPSVADPNHSPSTPRAIHEESSPRSEPHGEEDELVWEAVIFSKKHGQASDGLEVEKAAPRTRRGRSTQSRAHASGASVSCILCWMFLSLALAIDVASLSLTGCTLPCRSKSILPPGPPTCCLLERLPDR